MNPDVAAELKDLSATLESIEAVTDLPALRAEIADLSEQAGRPDLWNDPEAAQKVTSRLSHAQGDLRRVEELRRRLDDLPMLYELAEEEGDEGVARRGRRRARPQLHQDIDEPRGPHAALGRVRLPRGAGDDPLGGRRGRRRRLRRDAHAHVPALGRAARLRHRRLRHLLRRGGRASSRPRSRSTRPTPTARSRSSRAPTGWCGSRRSTTRAAGRPRSPASRWLPVVETATTSRSTRRTCGSTSTAPRAPAARA